MEVLNPIYMTKLQKFWTFILLSLMKHDSVDRMFPFAKQDSEWGSRYEPKNNKPGVL